MWLEILRVTQGCARVNQVSGTLFWVAQFHWFQPCRGYVPKWGNSVALQVIHHFNTVYSNPGVRERETSDLVIPFLVKRTLVSLFSKGIFHILSGKGNKQIIQNSPVLAQMRGYPLGCAHQDYPLWHAYLWACPTIMIHCGPLVHASFEPYPGAWFAQDMPATAPAIIGHQPVGLPIISA